MKNTKRATDERYELLVEEVCKEHDCLNQKQIRQLGDLLEEYFETRSTAYEAVVEFLYLTEEIDFETKLDLDDLT